MKLAKKLVVQREHLRALNDPEAGLAAGGSPFWDWVKEHLSIYNQCPSAPCTLDA